MTPLANPEDSFGSYPGMRPMNPKYPEVRAVCGRFVLAADPRAVSETFEVPVAALPPRYNIAPGQKVAVVALKGDGRRALGTVRWRLVPHWANDSTGGMRPINARAETVMTSPVFKDSFRRKRCLLPATGFYEWMPGPKPSSPKTPFHFRLKSGEPFAFAGLWDMWGEGAEKLVTCCTLTVTPNEMVAPVHDRMPLIIPREHFGRWLGFETPVAELLTLLKPYPAAGMESYRVGKAVGNVKADGPECIAPVAEPATLF